MRKFDTPASIAAVLSVPAGRVQAREEDERRNWR